MKKTVILRPLPLTLALCAALPAQADERPLLLASHETLYIEILKPLPLSDVETEEIHRKEPAVPESAPDTASVLKTVPGADVNRNGPLTGIVQYRGMYGDRVDVRVDKMYVVPSCTNYMDPPLSLIPKGQLQSVTVYRGIAPVSIGINTFGGSIWATSLTSHFSDTGEFHSDGMARFDGSTADQGRNLNLFTSLANERHRMHLALTRDHGKDIDTPLGALRVTKYDRGQARVGYGFRGAENSEFGIELRRNRTRDTGTPALPMDIIEENSTTLRLAGEGNLAGGHLEAEIYGSNLEHDMDNFSLRPAGMKYRFSHAESEGRGVHLVWQPGSGHWKFGLDGHRATHDARITDPTNASFYVDNFNDVVVRRFSAFVEVDGHAGGGTWSGGLRMTRASTDAGTVNTSMAMMSAGVRTLRDRFNTADRSQTDTLIDAVLDYKYPLSADTELVAAIGHKMRSPTYQARYLWLPLESTGGLADGNTYVGDIGLDPERSWQIELGFDMRMPDWTLSPRFFYRRIDDYIQGIPATDATVLAVNSAMNGGKPVLQYANVDAKIYGFDALASWAFAEGWRLDADLSWTRGERRDIDDNLYRIAPPRLNLSLRRRWQDWEGRIGLQAYRRQKHVSATNNEQPTPGYAVWSAGLTWEPEKHLLVKLDIENLTDHLYYDHVGGYNRVANNIVPTGNRLPGAGRNVQLQLHWRW